MNDETKVNTNNGDAASPEAKNLGLPPEYVGRIETPYGAQYIDRGNALGHAYMRSKQLSSLLQLMNGEGLENFRLLRACYEVPQIN